jgi:hypothetical protein
MRSRIEVELIAALVAVVVLPPLWWAARIIWLFCRRNPRPPMSFLDVIDDRCGNDAQREHRVDGTKP